MEKVRVSLKTLFFVIGIVATALTQQEIFSGSDAKVVAAIALVANALFGYLDKTISNAISDSKTILPESDFAPIVKNDQNQ